MQTWVVPFQKMSSPGLPGLGLKLRYTPLLKDAAAGWRSATPAGW